MAMLENFNEGKRKNPMTQFSDFHTEWSIPMLFSKNEKTKIYSILKSENFLSDFLQYFRNHKGAPT